MAVHHDMLVRACCISVVVGLSVNQVDDRTKGQHSPRMGVAVQALIWITPVQLALNLEPGQMELAVVAGQSTPRLRDTRSRLRNRVSQGTTEPPE
jgi:hypothetical protein